MLARIYSAAVLGVDAFEVEIEVNTGGGQQTNIIIVGLPDAAVKESRDRVTTAIQNSGYRWPQERTTINLAPAHVKKEGPSFDLPIALGMIAAAHYNQLPEAAAFSIVGELALTGAVRPVRGVLPIALEARRQGKRGVLVPTVNAKEAALVAGLEVYPVANLREAYEFLAEQRPIAPVTVEPATVFAAAAGGDLDFADVRGQHGAKRALEIAAAGEHNLLLIGPPGAGKSMLAQRLPTILPQMTMAEAIATTKIHSISGLLADGQAFVASRPFRAPHHTISDAGLLGGSANPSPGEVSLAHHGVLFLDELPEFKRSTLEVMRQPLEAGRVTISRASGTMTFPAEFMLVAAMNPCPCGWFGNTARRCRCSQRQVEQYRQRISGPLLDRIDLHLEVPPVTFGQLGDAAPAEASAAIRARVDGARARQAARFAGSPTRANARMTAREVRLHCALDPAARELLRAAMEEFHLSARAHDRILKVARTIADLAGADRVRPGDIGEAVGYRALDRNLWA